MKVCIILQEECKVCKQSGASWWWIAIILKLSLFRIKLSERRRGSSTLLSVWNKMRCDGTSSYKCSSACGLWEQSAGFEVDGGFLIMP